jgi:hypothetical protein
MRWFAFFLICSFFLDFFASDMRVENMSKRARSFISPFPLSLSFLFPKLSMILLSLLAPYTRVTGGEESFSEQVRHQVVLHLFGIRRQ